MQSHPSLPSLPGPLWLGVVATDLVLSMGQIELFDIKLRYLIEFQTSDLIDKMKRSFFQAAVTSILL